MARTIAIVEDEGDILANYVEAFKRQGYDVIPLRDRPQATEAFATRLPDLVVLDIGLKDEAEGGFELCRALRSRSASLPIIFLTAHDSDLDTISGLRLGADDYITKPFEQSELKIIISKAVATSKLTSGAATIPLPPPEQRRMEIVRTSHLRQILFNSKC